MAGTEVHALWPCTAGLLLEVRECVCFPLSDTLGSVIHAPLRVPPSQAPSCSGVMLLTHPLEPPLPVLADVSLRSGRAGSYAGWSSEKVVWAGGRQLPWAATYSEAAGRLALWRITLARLAPGAVGNLPDLPAATPLPCTPAGYNTGAGSAGGAAGSGGSSVWAGGGPGARARGGGGAAARRLSPSLPPAWTPCEPAGGGVGGSSEGGARGSHHHQRGGGGGGVHAVVGVQPYTPMSIAASGMGASMASAYWPSSVKK
jgi:hypothetical protein